MRDLRSRYSTAERFEFQDTLNKLRGYILPLLLRRQDGHCALCPDASGPFDIDHLLYNPAVTLDELRLLCWPCHKRVTWPLLD
jgi:hypothetical protein